jgi:hypothetical protein
MVIADPHVISIKRAGASGMRVEAKENVRAGASLRVAKDIVRQIRAVVARSH